MSHYFANVQEKREKKKERKKSDDTSVQINMVANEIHLSTLLFVQTQHTHTQKKRCKGIYIICHMNQ